MTIILVYLKFYILGNYIFGFGLLMLSGSLLFALLETLISTKALDIHLKNSDT
jgi:Na+/phosphate symporter